VSEKLAYTIAEAVAASGLGRTTIYELIKQGELPRVKVGGRTLIRAQDLAAMLERKLVRGPEQPEPPRTA
jgi:excisionase family DNA binding protein